MRVAFVTVGDTRRLTGGYLYNARVLDGLRAMGARAEEIVACGASVEDQRAAAAALGRFEPAAFDVIAVDALARVVAAPHLDRWRTARPVVAMVHELPSVAGVGEDPDHVAREREYEEPLLRADRFVAVSDHGRRLLEDSGVPGGRIHVVPPGFDRLSADVDEGARLARDAGTVRVLCVAQWIPRKGVLELVGAWTRRERPGAALELIGETDADPDYAPRVRAAAAPDASITARGAVDDATLSAAYAASDLFALPSRYEGYGMVYAEALSFGLPIVACEVGPVPELVGREAALLVPPGNPEALDAALDLVLGDADLRGRMSEAARRRAARLPRWEETVAGFYEVLRIVVSAGDHRRVVARDPTVARRGLREQNRLSWNAVVGAHESHRGDLAGFLAAGGSTLFPEELDLLGPVHGKTLVHLQCNSGGDSLSLANLGAKVTGVDISDEAVGSARDLSRNSSIPASFERADIYDWLEDAARRGRRFDLVYSSYGVVCWLPDLETWARGIARILNSGGRFAMVDFHPFADTLDEDWNLARDYPSGGEPLPLLEGVGDYVGEAAGGLTPAGFVRGARGFENPEPAHLFRWGIGEVVTALAGAGLRIAALREYPYSNGERHFAGRRELPGRRMAPPAGVPSLPLMYGIRAEKRS